MSVSKSITLFHGGLLARSERARQAGNQAEARHYEYQAGRVWEAIMEGNSKALYRFQGAAAAVAAAVTESALTRMFGVAWVQRRDGHGREIAGISQELMDAFSSRRHTIVEAARKIADQRELEHGRLIRRCSCAPGRLRSTMRRRLRTGSGATSAVRWPAPPASASVSKSDTDRRNRSAF